MQSTASIISQLSSDNPRLSFEPGDYFAWSPAKQTVYYVKDSKDAIYFILHELAHALLKHESYSRDIELISMERQAWDHAITMGEKYKVAIDDELAQSNLDSYRDWLHARSTCPNCTATGIQDTKDTYSCLACGHNWRVNEARICELRRYKI